MLTSSACFLFPQLWGKYRNVIEHYCIDETNGLLRTCFETLTRRNAALRTYTYRSAVELRHSKKYQIIVLLDALPIKSNFMETARKCLRITKEGDMLVSTCVEWSSSIYRHGSFRTYAAARLLRIWSSNGIELQRPLCNLLVTASDRRGLSRSSTFKLYAILVSSNHFSVGRYLQWLMARGTLHRQSAGNMVGLFLIGNGCIGNNATRTARTMLASSLRCLSMVYHLTL